MGAGIQAPAVNAFLPQIIPGERLIRVNSINSTIQPFILIAAPIASGTLLSFSSLEYIFFIDVVTAALAVGLLLILKAPPLPRSAEPRKRYLDDLAAGLAYARGHRPIKTLFALLALVFFLITPVAFLSPLLVTRSFGDEVWRLRANEITFFGGSVVGGIIMTAWGGFENRFRTIGLSSIVWALLFAALGLAQDFVLYLVVMPAGAATGAEIGPLAQNSAVGDRRSCAILKPVLEACSTAGMNGTVERLPPAPRPCL